MNKKYKVLLFDLDNTLLSFDKAEDKSIKQTLLHFGLTPTIELISEFRKINLYYWECYEKGIYTRDEILVKRFSDFLEGKSNEDPQEVNIYYLNQLSYCSDLEDYADEVLEKLKDDYKIEIVTNGVYETQMRRINSSIIKKYIDKIFVSEKIGYQKPKKEFFDVVFNTLQVKKEDALLIGDSLTADMLGGVQYGIDTCFYNPKNIKTDMKVTYIINDLRNLYNILK